MRGGFTTHAMNMGQRHVQLNNTFTVQSDGTIILHVAQAPNPFILQPGPAFLFVNVHGIPSNGSYVIVGSGDFGTQPTSPASVLPATVLADDSVTGTAAKDSVGGSTGSGSGSGSSSGDNGDDSGNGNGSGTSSSTSHLGEYIGIGVGAAAALGIIAGLGIFLTRRGRSGRRSLAGDSTSYAMTAGGQQNYKNVPYPGPGSTPGSVGSFAPLHQPTNSDAWNHSTTNLTQGPYQDEPFDPRDHHYDHHANSVRAVPQTGYR
ncbi:hypothetical protein H0H93_010481 [Arthromyces matolae]|nr:hypothetical protein H0H93_010481 [Arthromyces matolae]